MNTKQAATLRRLKAIENKAYNALIAAVATACTSAEAIAALGEDHALVTAWRKAYVAPAAYFDSIPRRA
jgi:hypothetical protein